MTKNCGFMSKFVPKDDYYEVLGKRPGEDLNPASEVAQDAESVDKSEASCHELCTHQDFEHYLYKKDREFYKKYIENATVDAEKILSL